MASGDGQISLVRIGRSTIRIPIVGITPYIPNQFSEKVRNEMREKRLTDEGSQIKTPRKARKPEQEANDAAYWLVPDQVPGIPAVHFAKAMIGAVRAFSGITMVGARGMLWVLGTGPQQLVAMHDATWKMQEDVVRVGGRGKGAPDLRYRNYFDPWRCEVEVGFKPQLITAESVIALLEEAGSLGIGEWRPSSTAGGQYGQFAIDSTREVEVMHG